MAEIARCLVCGVFDVTTISLLSSSGADMTIHLCVGHEKTFHIGLTSILLRMRQDFREFAEAIDGAALLDAQFKEEPRG